LAEKKDRLAPEKTPSWAVVLGLTVAGGLGYWLYRLTRPPALAPVLDLKMDEGEGTIAHDTSGHGNHGDLKPGPAPNYPTWVDGYYEKALSFDGVDDYVDCGSRESLDITGAITLEVWVKPAGVSGANAELVGKTEDYKGYSFYLGPNGDIIRLLLGTGTWIFGPAYSWPNGYGVWYHIVGRWDGTDVRLFANGVDIGSPASLTGSILTTTNTLKIGKHYALASYFNGTIDEVRIYNRALSADEIKAHFLGARVPKAW